MASFRIDVDLEDLTETGLAAALAVVTGNPESPTQLTWSDIGPIIERHKVSLSYSASPELRIYKRGGKPQDDLDWTATLNGAQDMVLETAGTPLAAVAKAVIAFLAPLRSYPLPKRNILQNIKTTRPVERSLLNDSHLHKVIEGKVDRNVYLLIPRDSHGAALVRQEIFELVSLCKDFRVETWSEPFPVENSEYAVAVRHV